MRRKLAAVAGAAFGLMLATTAANAELDLLSRLFGRPFGQAAGRDTVRIDTGYKPGTIIIIPKGTAHGGTLVASGPVKTLVVQIPPQAPDDVVLLN